METTMRSRSSTLLGLFRALTRDTRTFIRQEIQLVKTEVSEKVSKLGRNAATLAIGGFIAYAGLIVFLIGLGWLLSFAFQSMDMAPALASFIGLAIIGFLTIGIGVIFLMKGLKTIQHESLAPQKTIQTLKDLKGGHHPAFEDSEEHKASSTEMQTRVEATENRMGETLDELGRRLSPSHINAEVKARISAKPYKSGLIAMAAGVISGLFLRRKLSQA